MLMVDHSVCKLCKGSKCMMVVVSSFRYLRTFEFEIEDITQFEIERASSAKVDSSILSGAATSSSDISTVV